MNILPIGGMQSNAVISGLKTDTTYTMSVEAVTSDKKLLEVGEIEVTTEKGMSALKCIRGGVHWDKTFHSSRLLLKRVKIISAFILVIA